MNQAMPAAPACPQCAMGNAYPDGNEHVCADAVVRDANGKVEGVKIPARMRQRSPQ